MPIVAPKNFPIRKMQDGQQAGRCDSNEVNHLVLRGNKGKGAGSGAASGKLLSSVASAMSAVGQIKAGADLIPGGYGRKCKSNYSTPGHS